MVEKRGWIMDISLLSQRALLIVTSICGNPDTTTQQLLLQTDYSRMGGLLFSFPSFLSGLARSSFGDYVNDVDGCMGDAGFGKRGMG